MEAYKIDIATGIYDKGFHMVNALQDFLDRNNFDWLKKDEPFLIKKPIHLDGNIEFHFTFLHRGISYHAYVRKVITIVNGTPMELKVKIYRITALNIWNC
jgi:hypothetical protein